jgi:hypothetical protein
MMRFLWKSVVSLVVATTCSACGSDGSVKRSTEGVESFVQIAPDGESKAFVWRPKAGSELGATVSTVYQLWIQDLHHTKEEQLILTADKTHGFRLVWTGPTELQVCYVDGQIFDFRNVFSAITQDMPKAHSVEIILQKVATLESCGVKAES